MEQKGCELIIHDHDVDLWVTMAGWVNVQFSYLGDFRHWRAVDLSSLIFVPMAFCLCTEWLRMDQI